MATKKVKKPKGVESLKSRYGRLFVLPWEIGLVLFFIVPIIKSIYYSLCEVSLTNEGIATQFVGIEHYDYIINKHPDYIKTLQGVLVQFLTQLPIILALSLILAIILNQKFVGRIIARAIFFMPVIIATGVIIEKMTSQQIGISLVASAGGDTQYGSMIDFDAILKNLGLPDDINKLIAEYIGSVFNLLWSCGIQIVLFIAGLQTIQDQHYEVSRVEGASKWEEFWYITIPMLGPTILLVGVYTMIDLFTQDAGVMGMAFQLMSKANYDQSSAMLWLYMVVAGGMLAIILAIYNQLCLKKWS